MCLTPLSYPEYDQANQLTREDNAALGKSFTYSYDKGGNIVSKSEYEFTTGTLGTATETMGYAYDSTWKDKLVSYDSTSITYNALGNPLIYGNTEYVWRGRELAERKINNVTDITLRCDANGLLTRKNTNIGSDDEADYVYAWSEEGTLLGYRVDYDEESALSDLIVLIVYDENNEAIGFTVKEYNETPQQEYVYYYIKNAQGDVLRVVDETGATMADYTYDAWGNFTYTAGPNAGANADIIEKYNPVTYRGYYYDNDLEMYYLQSRYYNPQWGRFLNADDTSMLGTEQGNLLQFNLYAYCMNNPINMIDEDGYMTEVVTQNVIPGVTVFVVLCAAAAGVPAVVLFTGGVVLGLVASYFYTPVYEANPKPRNLPSFKKLTLDKEHIMSGHSSNGNRGAPNKKDKFPNWMKWPAIQKAIEEAYDSAKKLQTQGDRVFLVGYSKTYKIIVQMWVNLETKVIETAWPK